MEAKFSNIYAKNIWGGSGSGSKLSHDNINYLNKITDIIEKYEIGSILDVGCGDWEIMKELELNKIHYVGIDIVKSVIENNINKYGQSFRHYNVADGINENYDLIIIKDVLQHLEDDVITKIMNNLLEKGKYVFCINGYKFGRSPEKNDWTTRDINNRYSYHPVSSVKEPLIQHKDFIKERYFRRCKEYVLYTKIKSEEY